MSSQTSYGDTFQGGSDQPSTTILHGGERSSSFSPTIVGVGCSELSTTILHGRKRGSTFFFTFVEHATRLWSSLGGASHLEQTQCQVSTKRGLPLKAELKKMQEGRCLFMPWRQQQYLGYPVLFLVDGKEAGHLKSYFNFVVCISRDEVKLQSPIL